MKVRQMGLSFEDLPRHWFFEHRIPTTLVNALSLLFPAGERFFIRSVKRFEAEIDDPALKAAMRSFYGQEAHHQKEHAAANRVIERHGFELESFFGWWERFAFTSYARFFTPEQQLAGTAAAEHFTATLAELALSPGNLEHAHPAMRALLMWHAAEEIEHKSVAFDVLQRVDGRYRTRIIGFVGAGAVLLFGWAVATRHLLRQDPAPRRSGKTARREKLPKALWQVAKSLADYWRPGFHPDQRDNRPLAQRYLASIDRLAG